MFFSTCIRKKGALWDADAVNIFLEVLAIATNYLTIFLRIMKILILTTKMMMMKIYFSRALSTSLNWFDPVKKKHTH